MNSSGISWRGPSIDDTDIFEGMPKVLVDLLLSENGYILHSGALHIRGAVKKPLWHSLRHAWHGEEAFHRLYPDITPTDVPFAEDMLGDQFFLRDRKVISLLAETGEVEAIATSLDQFLESIDHDIEEYLNISLSRKIEPGALLFAWPPFCMEEGGSSSKLKSLPADEVIRFHADFASQVRQVPDGGKIQIQWTD